MIAHAQPQHLWGALLLSFANILWSGPHPPPAPGDRRAAAASTDKEGFLRASKNREKIFATYNFAKKRKTLPNLEQDE